MFKGMCVYVCVNSVFILCSLFFGVPGLFLINVQKLFYILGEVALCYMAADNFVFVCLLTLPLGYC